MIYVFQSSERMDYNDYGGPPLGVVAPPPPTIRSTPIPPPPPGTSGHKAYKAGINTAQQQQIVRQCVLDLVSPTDLGRKWSVNPDTIRTWVRKAGMALPTSYKKVDVRDPAYR